jgi:hypothetical protein
MVFPVTSLRRVTFTALFLFGALATALNAVDDEPHPGVGKLFLAFTRDVI